MGHSRLLILFIFSVSAVSSKYVHQKWLDLNNRPLVSEANALPTEPKWPNIGRTIWSSGHSAICFPENRQRIEKVGSGFGSVGRAVASDSRGLLFKSSHRQKILLNVCCQLYWKDEDNEKEAGIGPYFFKKKDREEASQVYRGPSFEQFDT